MSHMPDFNPNNSIPPIFYGSNHFHIHLIATEHSSSWNLLQKFSNLNIFAILSYHYGFFKKTLKFLFLVNLHHFVEHYEDRKDEEPIWSEEWDITAYKCHFLTFLCPFWENCNFEYQYFWSCLSFEAEIFKTF